MRANDNSNLNLKFIEINFEKLIITIYMLSNS